MNKTWLLLDSNFLVWRSHHALKFLSFKEVRTEVILGYLKGFLDFQKSFCTKNVAHIFDSKKSKRKEICDTYKNRRDDNKLTQDEIILKNEVRKQIKELRKAYLPEIGCKNVFIQTGYEADDVIATICQALPADDNAIIISSDKDLFQLLSSNISIYNPTSKKVYTQKMFEDEWKITPKEWCKVKALAGCGTDDVDGIDGVGEKTAVKYLRGEVKETAKVYSKIAPVADATIKKNLPLVTIPYPGCGPFELVEDELSKEGWDSLTERLGLSSIKNLKRSMSFDTRTPLF